MTGFGKATAELAHKKVTVELKSLNSKQLDLTMKVAPQYRELEMDLRRTVMAAVERGKVEMSLTVEVRGAVERPVLNIDVIEDYYRQVDELRQRVGAKQIPFEEMLPTLLRLPDAIRTECDDVADEELEAVRRVVERAVSEFVAFRRQEGEMLYRVFDEKLRNIAALLAEVRPYEQERTEAVRRSLVEKLEQLPVSYDKNRFEQELIYYIEKLDINEEKHRLDNHLRYFRETMDSAELGAGKKLGFIAQEMGREINTLGSKANHAELQRIVVRMKDELEQIKEQVLNVL